MIAFVLSFVEHKAICQWLLLRHMACIALFLMMHSNSDGDERAKVFLAWRWHKWKSRFR